MALNAKETTQRLTVVPSLANEVILFPDTPNDDDYHALAAALHADVAKVGDRWRLYRSDATIKSLSKNEQIWLREGIGKSNTKREELIRNGGSVKAEVPFKTLQNARAKFDARKDDKVADFSGLQAAATTPAAKVLSEYLKQISDFDLALAKPGKLTTFSNNPTNIEERLRLKEAQVSEYVREQSEFAAWAESASGAGRISNAYGWAFPSRPFLPGPRTFQIFIDRRETFPTFAITVFDSAGKVEATSLLDGNSEVFGPSANTSGRLGRTTLPKDLLSEEKCSGSDSLTATAAQLDPVMREPLDRLPKAALILWANAKGFKKVIACVPDGLWESASGCLNGDVFDLDAFSVALDKADLESIKFGDTLVVRPRNPLQEEATRIDRRPLSQLLWKLARSEFSVDDLFRYHSDYAERYERSRFLQQLERNILTAAHIKKDLNWFLPHSFLAILGQLTSGEKTMLASGKRIALAPSRFSSCLASLAEAATANPRIVTTDLERTPTHLAAVTDGIWLGGASFTQSLVRRVSKEFSQVTNPDPVTQQPLVQRGFNLVIDNDFIPLDMAALGSPKGEVFKTLDQRFSFYWAEEQVTEVVLSYGRIAQSGPYSIRVRGKPSQQAVPLEQVPGSEKYKP
jgi:hypothetical protein